MKLPTLLTSALLAIIAPIPCAAEGSKYWTSESGAFAIFTVTDPSPGCRVITLYENDDYIYVTYDPKLQNVLVGFTEKDATSISEGQELQIKPVFVINNKLDEGWGAITANAGVLSDGKRLFTLSLDAKDFLIDYSKARILAFYTEQDVLIGSFDLNGSTLAIKKLRACAFQQAGLNPNDPFLK